MTLKTGCEGLLLPSAMKVKKNLCAQSKKQEITKKLCSGAFSNITWYFEFHIFTALQTVLRIPQTSRFTILIMRVIATDYSNTFYATCDVYWYSHQ